MHDFEETFEKRKGSFIRSFSICLTVPLRKTRTSRLIFIACSWYLVILRLMCLKKLSYEIMPAISTQSHIRKLNYNLLSFFNSSRYSIVDCAKPFEYVKDCQ